MNDEALISLSNRMKSDLFIGFVGSCRSGKSSLINSFFKLLILPNVEDEFLKHKILDELPQTAEGKQIMTVEPKFIPSTSIELNVNNTVMNLRFVDCVGEIIPSAEGLCLQGKEQRQHKQRIPGRQQGRRQRHAVQRLEVADALLQRAAGSGERTAFAGGDGGVFRAVYLWAVSHP